MKNEFSGMAIDDYRMMVENTSDLIALVDPEGRIRFQNPSVERILGYRAEELVGGTVFDLLHPEDVEAAVSALQRVLVQPNVSHPIELRLRTRGGEWRVMEALGRRTPEGSRIPGVVINARDVTRRHELLEEVRASEARFRELAENINEVLWITDAEKSAVLYVNPAYERVWGISLENLAENPMSWLELVVEEDRDRVRSATLETQSSGEYNETYRILRPDGTERWIEERAVPIRRDGEVVRIVGIAEDITARKVAEDEQSCLNAVMESAVEGIARMDADGRHVYVNTAFAQIAGYSSDEMIGMNSLETVDPRDRTKVMDGWRRMGAEGRTEVEVRGLRPDGSVYHKQITMVVPSAEASEDHYWFVKDVTETKEIEARIQQTQKMEAVGRLAGGTAHDFNNMLTVIQGHTKIALDGLSENSPLRDELEEVRRSARRASSLVQQLLVFSRKQTIRPRMLDINAQVRETRKMMKTMLGDGIELHTKLEPELGPVYFDPSQLNRVLVNLVFNAKDAMSSAGGRLTLETTNADLDEEFVHTHPGSYAGRYVVLAVGDTGHGMDRETRARIFEPFYTTKEAGKGAGLGLATVHGIVRQNDGYITVYSEPGRGTTFKIYLPRQNGEVLDVVVPAEEIDAPAGPLSGTVLLVEDDPNVRALACSVLSSAGLVVLEANSAEQARGISEGHNGTIDLVLSDMSLPDGNGCAMLAEILEHRPRTTGLLMSGFTADALRASGKLFQRFPFIEKPFTPNTLLRKIGELLAGRT